MTPAQVKRARERYYGNDWIMPPWPVRQEFLDALNATLENAGVRIGICADSSLMVVTTKGTKDQEVGK